MINVFFSPKEGIFRTTSYLFVSRLEVHINTYLNTEMKIFICSISESQAIRNNQSSKNKGNYLKLFPFFFHRVTIPGSRIIKLPFKILLRNVGTKLYCNNPMTSYYEKTSELLKTNWNIAYVLSQTKQKKCTFFGMNVMWFTIIMFEIDPVSCSLTKPQKHIILTNLIQKQNVKVHVPTPRKHEFNENLLRRKVISNAQILCME